MRKFVFIVFWVLLALALPYSLKAQERLPGEECRTVSRFDSQSVSERDHVAVAKGSWGKDGP